MQRLIKILQANIILVFILIFGATVRLVGLDIVPPSLNWDEVSHGYNAYSILKTGRDEWGEVLPNIFRAYGDYKLPVYIYSTVPFITTFGLNEWSVRLPSAIAGTLLILFTYLLVIQLFKRRNIGLLAALFVAIEPWSFFLSRTAVEANLALFLVVAGTWLTLRSFEIPPFRWTLVLGAIFLGLSVWTYNSVRIFVPLLLVALVFLYKKEFNGLWQYRKTLTAYYFLLTTFFFLPMFYQLANSQGQARYEAVEILDEGAISQINAVRASSSLPEPLSILAHNKVTYFAQSFLKNYVGYFSPNFLFLEGGSQYQFSVPGKGLIYPTEFIFIMIGLLWLIKTRSKESTIILIWFLLAPVAASLTREPQHVLRSIVMMPMPQLLAALGLVVTWNYLKSKKLEIGNWKLEINLRYILVPVYLILLLYFIESYAITYVDRYREEYSWSWQYGYKEAVQFAKDNYNNYNRIIMTKKYGEPHEFVLFYMKWDPEKYRNDPNLIRFGQSNWFWVDRFDKFYFVNDWQVPRDMDGVWKLESGGVVPIDGRTLLITSPGNYPPGWSQLKTINFLDGKPAFEILERL